MATRSSADEEGGAGPVTDDNDRRRQGTIGAIEPGRVSVEELGVIEETMLITLWARAEETRRRDGLIEDPCAVELIESIEYDFTKFRHAWKSQVGVAVRTRFLDDATRRFIERHPDAVVVNVGAGLDTRFNRVDNGRLTWVDLDTPSALALRRRVLPANPRQLQIAHDATETSWIDQLPPSPTPALFVSEGVVMFLDRHRVRALLDRLAAAFPRGEILMDVIGGLMVRCPWLHDSLPQTRARFAWGTRGRPELERWSTRYDVLGVHSMLDEAPNRWRWMRLLRRVPVLRRQFGVAHLRFRAGIAGDDRNHYRNGGPPRRESGGATNGRGLTSLTADT